MKPRVNLFILSLVVLLLTSCGDNKQLKDGDTIFFPDTVNFKQAWQMQEYMMQSESFGNDTFYNQLGLDTFELTYTPCDCPDWIDVSKLPLDCKECSDFYVDPNDSYLELPEEFYVAGNTVRFFGVRIPGMNLPLAKEFVRSDPPAWTVIHYYGYEVLRPYKVWGHSMKKYRNGDTTAVPVTVTIQ